MTLRIAFSLIIVLILTACTGDGDVKAAFKPQVWRQIQISLESRPAPMRPGMNELLVIATGPRGLPVSELVVSMRMDDHEPWRQAIQDGGSGVFRRAVQMNPGDTKVFVRLLLRSKDKAEPVTMLVFPIPSH